MLWQKKDTLLVVIAIIAATTTSSRHWSWHHDELHYYGLPTLENDDMDTDPWHQTTQAMIIHYYNGTVRSPRQLAAATSASESFAFLRKRRRHPLVETKQGPWIYQAATTLQQQQQHIVLPLAQGYGTHWATLWIGHPIPQRQTVIVDTGSHHTAIPCLPCPNCGHQHHTNPSFDESLSETFVPYNCSQCLAARNHPSKETTSAILEQTYYSNCLSPHLGNNDDTDDPPCEFSQAYTEGSHWKARHVRDVVQLGGSNLLQVAASSSSRNSKKQNNALNFTFGCMTENSGLFVTQLANGILGMSMHPSTLLYQLYQQQKISSLIFSLCLRKEWGTSKQGVAAGSLTLGGFGTALDTGPLRYATLVDATLTMSKQRTTVASASWFTIQVRNVYLMTSSSSLSSYGNNVTIAPVPHFDPEECNSGKGVIVDSGTTDTYLSRHLAVPFAQAWKQVVGVSYTHKMVSLTDRQLQALPTILLQVRGKLEPPPARTRTGKQDAIVTTNKTITTGWIGADLDPHHPSDVVLAIPPSSYMEYSPALDRYTARIYFTESQGGVVGSNSLQGHNVVFDWQRKLIGFAPSTCYYDVPSRAVVHASQNVSKEEDGQPRHPLWTTAVLEDPQQRNDDDCSLLVPPILSKACWESVNLEICRHNENPTNLALEGTEVWTHIMERQSTNTDVCRRQLLEKRPANDVELGASVVNCTGQGVCSEVRPCQVYCATALQEEAQAREQVTVQDKSTDNNTGNLANNGNDDICASSHLWSVCDADCSQTRIRSMPIPQVASKPPRPTNPNVKVFANPDQSNDDDDDENPTAICRFISQERRPCHTDLCRQHLPASALPVLVQASFYVQGGRAHLWSPKWRDVLVDAMALAAANVTQWVKAGNVEVVLVQSSNGASATRSALLPPQGIKVTIQILLPNEAAIHRRHQEESPQPRPHWWQFSSNNKDQFVSANRRSLLHEELPQDMVVASTSTLWDRFWQTSQGQANPPASPASTDPEYYKLAQQAGRIAHEVVGSSIFLGRLQEELQLPEEKNNPFSGSNITLWSAWTVGTQPVTDEIEYLTGPAAWQVYGMRLVTDVVVLWFVASTLFLGAVLGWEALRYVYGLRHWTKQWGRWGGRRQKVSVE